MSSIRLAAIAAILAAAGCAGMGPASDGADMRKLLGKPLSTLTEVWGPPTDRRVAAGERLYSWELGADGRAATGDGGGSVCNATVRVDEHDVVTGYYSDGDDCAAAAGRL